MMSSAGIPLRVIQEISGHNDLGTLQRYLEVSPEQNVKLLRQLSFERIQGAISRTTEEREVQCAFYYF